MGGCVNSKPKINEPQKKSQSATPKPPNNLAGQKSRLSTRSQKLDKLKKISLGKPLSFKKLSIDSILKPPPIHNNEEASFKFKRCLLSGKSSNLTEKDILDDFGNNYKDFNGFSLIKYNGNSLLVGCKDNAKKEILIKRKSFEQVENFSEYLLHIQSISKYKIPGIEVFIDIRMDKREGFGYIIDIIKEKKGESLNHYLDRINWKNSKDYLILLEIVKRISIIMAGLHRNNVAFKTLKPSTVLIIEENANINVILPIAGTNASEKEDSFVDFYVKTEEDYRSFDIISLGFLLITLLTEKISMEDLYIARNNQDITKIIEKTPEIPKVLSDLIKKMLDLENRKIYQNSIQLISELEGLILKGVENQFKSDFMTEILKSKSPKPPNHDLLYFAYKNKIFIHQTSRKLTIVLRVFLGSRKWKIRDQNVVFCEKTGGFLTFADQKSCKIAKIPFSLGEIGSNPGKFINLKKEIEFFYEFQVKRHHYSRIVATESTVLLISQELCEVSGQNIEVSGISAEKKERKLLDFKYFDEYFYPFLDYKRENLYILHESKDFFKNGILALKIPLSNPNESSEFRLELTINNSKMLGDFKNLHTVLNNVMFNLEVAQGVFLINAGRILLVLEIEGKRFHSFSSLFQLENHHQLGKRIKEKSFHDLKEKYHITSIENIASGRTLVQGERLLNHFEVRNAPFEPDFSIGGFCFEDGILEFFCKRNSDLLLCKFIVIPNQSCLSMLNCQDLSLGKDFMVVKPRQQKLSYSLLHSIDPPSHIPKPEIPRKIREYEIISEMALSIPGLHEYKARKKDQNQYYCLRRFEVSSLEEFQAMFKNFLFIVENSYVLGVAELFIMEEDNKLSAVIVREYFERTLQEEFLHRKTKSKFYAAKNIAFLMKCVYKGINYLREMNITHGNMDLSNIVITDKGFVKIKGWYYQNKPTFQNDLMDLGAVLLDLATLEINYEFNQAKINGAKGLMEINYPGLAEFLEFIVEGVGNSSEVNKWVQRTYFKLMYKDLDFGKYLTEKQRLFWINYNANSIISTEISSKKHQSIKVKDPEGKPYIFSTFNNFTFDLGEKLYITGNKRSTSLKVQDFFELSLSQQSEFTLRPLPSIPINILNPTVLFVPTLNSIMLFGGYLPTSEASTKSLSSIVLIYNIQNKAWSKCSRMPISLVSSTAIFTKKGIYLFGGISEELDLTGPELNFLHFDLQHDTWSFLVNFSIRSPFVNSRLLQPNVVHLGDEVFLFFDQHQTTYELNVFELTLGGLSLKFEQNFKQEGAQHETRILQNDSSLGFNAGVVYKLEEGKRNLMLWDIRNFEKLEIGKEELKGLEEEDDEFEQFENMALNKKK